MSDNNVALIRTAGRDFSVAEAAANAAVERVAAILGTDPTYQTWESTRTEWQAGYAEHRREVSKVEPSAESVGKAWQRFAKRMGELFGVEKPKAPSAGAQRKAAARNEAAAKVDAIVKKHKGSVAAIRKASQALKADAPAAEVKLYADALVQASKAAEKAAADKAKETVKKARESIAAAMKDMSAEQLQALAHVATMIRAGKKVSIS